jgi:hypothetical protein
MPAPLHRAGSILRSGNDAYMLISKISKMFKIFEIFNLGGLQPWVENEGQLSNCMDNLAS